MVNAKKIRIQRSGCLSPSQDDSFDLSTKPLSNRLLPNGWRSIQILSLNKKIVIESPTGERFKTPKSLATFLGKIELTAGDFTWELHPWTIGAVFMTTTAGAICPISLQFTV